MKQSSFTKLFQIDKDVQCQKCRVKFTNRNQKKRHMYGEEVRFELSNLSTSYRSEAKMGKTILNIDIFMEVEGLIIK